MLIVRLLEIDDQKCAVRFCSQPLRSGIYEAHLGSQHDLPTCRSGNLKVSNCDLDSKLRFKMLYMLLSVGGGSVNVCG